MKAERDIAPNTLRGTLLLRMATLDTLRKRPASSSVEGSLPSSLAKRYFDCQKTKGAGFKPPREAARSLQFSRFFFEIWEREAAPAELMPDITAIYRRLLSESAAKCIGS